MRARIRITVAKRLLMPDLVAAHATGDWQPCERLAEGQEFISQGDMPEGFCSWAWVDIQRYVLTLSRGGNFIGSKPGHTVACCSDGYRPVIFALERLEGEE
jgi:uncharacterized repeat protein (TIGR04076 family)